MKKVRIIYFILIFGIVFLGLISRQISFIPLFIGDILWSIMIFFIVKFILIKVDVRYIFLVSLILCYIVEFSQLYQAEWINNIRKTIFGRLVLGQGFLWNDIFSYTIGVIVATLSELIKQKLCGIRREV
ncbi:MAG: DUF2809 domain-containing protein [Bacillota bacterium]|nr:DUF2809 domain-containing protein [Bacillota bacterium]